MTSNSFKNALLLLTSTAAALLVTAGAYEIYASKQYTEWRARYESEGDWYAGLTVPSNDPILMWEYRANGVGNILDSTITTNSHGFRDQEHSLRKRAGVLRIAFVGDSVTVGIGVADREIFVRQFEDIARQRFPTMDIEALAIAVDGYSAFQVMQLIEKRALRFQPDMVVYVMCMNDFDTEDASGEKKRYFAKPSSFSLARIQQLYRRFYGYYEYHFQKNKDQVYARIGEVKKALTSQGIIFRVAIMPTFPKHSSGVHPLTSMRRSVEETLQHSGIMVNDLMDSPLGYGDARRKYALDGWHLNAHGHRLVAELLVASLLGTDDGANPRLPIN